jgi:hypothetical protein
LIRGLSRHGFLDVHSNFAVRFLSQKADEAKAGGLSTLRVIGEMTWALGDDADSGRLIEFELKVNRLVRHGDVTDIWPVRSEQIFAGDNFRCALDASTG